MPATSDEEKQGQIMHEMTEETRRDTPELRPDTAIGAACVLAITALEDVITYLKSGELSASALYHASDMMQVLWVQLRLRAEVAAETEG